MKMNGEIALDELSNELGLESDRVRRLSTEAITDEISTFGLNQGSRRLLMKVISLWLTLHLLVEP